MICWVEGLPSAVDPAAYLGEGRFALSRHLLSLCQGRLWVEEDGAGLPVLLFGAPIAKPCLILTIDDDPATIGLYRRYLQGSTGVVIEAHTAEQAEAVLAEHRPDVILLDVMMPRRDGWTVLHALKARPETAGIPIVICSVIDEPDLALALGATAVLKKPISREQLLQAIQVAWSREDRTD